jgi:hypothetical protein
VAEALPPDAAVAIHIGMDVDEDEMPEHHADSRMRLFAQKVEERRHSIRHRVPVQGHLHRLADIDLAVAVAREIGGRRHAWEIRIPARVIARVAVAPFASGPTRRTA